MLVPSHLYSSFCAFCEPSFVKGGVFHSGKIAFNIYACIQFKFKTDEMSLGVQVFRFAEIFNMFK